MAVGFRKSLFGFNCDDVIGYIEKTHKTFSQRENQLNLQMEELKSSLDLTKENYDKLNEEKEKINKKLKSFTDKYEEIERLSENIGKLYLVAQANAQAIISNSESSAKLADSEIEKNLFSIDEAHDSLNELRQNIVQTSNEFVNEVNNLIASLSETREKISSNTASSIVCKNQFDEIYKSLTK